MICHAMRERMLDAELDELQGRGSSPLAVHIRECAACAGIARGIGRDTRVLAFVAANTPFRVLGGSARRRRNRSYVMVGAAAALAASVLFVVENRTREPESLRPALVVAPAARTAPADTVVLRRLPVIGQRFADATPVVAVPLVPRIVEPPSSPADEPAMVRVDPPEGVRAAVMQTSNPSITVVVLYKSSSGMQK